MAYAPMSSFENAMRDNIVEAAYSLYQSKASFATYYYSKCNEDYWKLTNEGGFSLRDNASPSAAIQDIFDNGQLYAFECATAMMMILFKAVQEQVSEQHYNQIYQRIYLWDWNTHPHLPIHIQHGVRGGRNGDIRYFKNPAVNPKTPQWQGENVIQLPNGQFYGHGIGMGTADEFIQELNDNRRPGAQQSAYLMNRATRPRYDVLQSFINGVPSFS
ncbi:hypothetical protein [Tuberibacillus sp. Marseille-P3662]|uniref:hypothetical protein n=1 Tax=Tuberibacillus sp. Marseille-P3662 TaxID=1965358 RepID=UPI000A1C9667|nr:hypothetical protein [Tuberibacillus sp. Marseille-P3662]